MAAEDVEHLLVEVFRLGRRRFGGLLGGQAHHAEELRPWHLERVGDLQQVPQRHRDLAAEDLLVDGVADAHLLLQRADGDTLPPDLPSQGVGNALGLGLVAFAIHGSRVYSISGDNRRLRCHIQIEMPQPGLQGSALSLSARQQNVAETHNWEQTKERHQAIPWSPEPIPAYVRATGEGGMGMFRRGGKKRVGAAIALAAVLALGLAAPAGARDWGGWSAAREWAGGLLPRVLVWLGLTPDPNASLKDGLAIDPNGSKAMGVSKDGASIDPNGGPKTMGTPSGRGTVGAEQSGLKRRI